MHILIKLVSGFAAFLFCFLIFIDGYSQSGSASIAGFLMNKYSNAPLEFATVTLMSDRDSTVVAKTISSEMGMFRLDSLPYGHYIFAVDAVGSLRYLRKLNISEARRDVQLDTVWVEPDSSSFVLKEVIVNGERIPFRMRNDTLEYNASAFHLHENSVIEDLLKKLPGVSIDAQGNITVMGQEVKRITVDGKVFFGDDPKIASRNLPADIADKIQVTEDKEDAANNIHKNKSRQSKVINIILKPENRTGSFGNAKTGYGTNDRYTVNLAGFRFNNDEKLSVIGIGNNLNQTDFDNDQLQSLRSDGNSGINIPYTGGDNLFENASGGIITSKGGGVNYGRDLASNLNITGGYFYGFTHLTDEMSAVRQNILPDTVFYQSGNSSSHGDSYSQKAGIDIKLKADSLTTLSMHIALRTNRNYADKSSTFTLEAKDSTIVNTGSQQYSRNGSGQTETVYIDLNRDFKRAGDYLRADISFRRNSETNRGYNIFNTQYFQPGVSVDSIVNQYFDVNSRGVAITSDILYHRSLDPVNSVNIEYKSDGNLSSNVNNSFNYDQLSKTYDQPDSQLTNNYSSRTFRRTLFAGYGRDFHRLGIETGFELLSGLIRANNRSENNVISREYYYYTPFTRTTFNISSTKAVVVEYSVDMRLPAIEQLQPVINNSNPLYLNSGNTGLKPERQYNLVFNYASFDAGSGTLSTIYSGYSIRRDAIVTGSSYDKNTGIQTNEPVNVNGCYNLFINGILSMPVKGIKNLDFKPRFNLTYSKNVIPENGLNNIGRTLNASAVLNFIYSPGKSTDISVNISEGCNISRYSLTPGTGAGFFNQLYSVGIKKYLPLGFKFSSDAELHLNSGSSSGYDQEFTIWNVFLAKEFLRNKAVSLQFGIFDLLRQNQQINRVVQGNYVSEQRDQAISRYYMLTFQYRFHNFRTSKDR